MVSATSFQLFPRCCTSEFCYPCLTSLLFRHILGDYFSKPTGLAERKKVFIIILFCQVKLDDKEMSSREFWKRQIIIARRHRRPASYGFYSPAREDNEAEGFIDGKRVSHCCNCMYLKKLCSYCKAVVLCFVVDNSFRCLC